MKLALLTLTVLALSVNTFASDKDSNSPKDFDFYKNGKAGDSILKFNLNSEDFAIIDGKLIKKNPYKISFNDLKEKSDVKISGLSRAIVDEIDRLTQLANETVRTGTKPDRLAITVHNTVHNIPGKPIYGNRGLRPDDLKALSELMNKIPPEKIDLKDPTIMKLLAAYKGLSGDTSQTWEHRFFAEQKTVSIVDRLGNLRRVVSGIDLGTLSDEIITIGKGAETIRIQVKDGKNYFIMKNGGATEFTTVTELTKKINIVEFEGKTVVMRYLSKIGKVGGGVASVAASAVLPLLLSHSMVGDANASTTDGDVSSARVKLGKQPIEGLQATSSRSVQ